MNTAKGTSPPSARIEPRSNAIRVAFKKISAVTLALAGICLILWFDSWFMEHADVPNLNRNMSYGLLFLVGFLTGFHCVGMCGPLIIGYTANQASAGTKSYGSHLLYGVGKTLSYTVIGGLFGAFGSIIAFTPAIQGAVGIAAGVFLILFGLHMLKVFPSLRHVQFKTPAFLMRFVGKEVRKHRSPFVVGLLNGLMIICGPLQAMYVMAAGSGSASTGAAMLFFFGLGTLPMLLGFGFLTSLLSANLTPKLLKASGVIVVILGSIMLNRGLVMTGSGADFNTLVAVVSQKLSPDVAETEYCAYEQIIKMDVLHSSFKPNKFTLRKGVPVKWKITVKELNECNKAIVVSKYNLDIKLQKGEQTVDFTPAETGVIPWSCWMGMIPGTFIVVENNPSPEQSEVAVAAKEGEPAPGRENLQQRWLRKIEAWWKQVLSRIQRTQSLLKHQFD